MFEAIRDHMVIAAVQAAEHRINGVEHGKTADEASDKKLGKRLSDGLKLPMAQYMLEFLEGLFHDRKDKLVQIAEPWLIGLRKKADPMQ